MSDGAPKLVLVTGPSGAGRSTCINVLEDLGFEAIDNLPLSLIGKLLSGAPTTRPLALGLDVRNRDFSAGAVLAALEDAKGPFGYDAELLYLDSSDDALMRRYSETRRRHPLAPQNTPQEGIALEKDLLAALRQRAESLIDTSDLTPHDLRAELSRRFGQSEDVGLAVSIYSFSYKRGLPRGADMVLDARFLQNPHWEPELRGLTGQDPRVQDYVSRDPRFDSFFAKTCALALELLPAYREEGKAHFVIAFGCTGGRHRSVTLAERVAKALAEKDWQVSIRHRELEREGHEIPPPQGETQP